MRQFTFGLVLAIATASAVADVTPLPRAQWPSTVEQAVPHIIAALLPAQKSILLGTSKENLPLMRGEWGEDIEKLLGLDDGNTKLATAACGRPCKSDDAALVLMEAAWQALQKSAR